MEHFCKVTELTFANTNQSHFEKTKDTSNHSAFVTQYTSNHNWLAVVDEQFINDNFNLHGITEVVPNFLLALKVLKGEINLNSNNDNDNYNKINTVNNTNNNDPNNALNPNQNMNNLNNDIKNTNNDENLKSTDELPDNIEQICIDSYNQIHARYIQTPKGLQIMRRKYEAGIFGICPRFLCNGQNLLPFGSSLMPSKAPARGYCPLCHDVYEADVLIEEQLELQRKVDSTAKDNNSKNDNQGNTRSESNDHIQNKENTKSLNSNSNEKSSDHSDTDSEDKQSKSYHTNENNQNNNTNNDQNNINNNNNNNDNENANLSESAEVTSNIQKNENQNDTPKNDQHHKKEIKILDGSCFGPYFPHFFLQMNRDLIPTSIESSEKTEKANSNVFSTIATKKSPDWKQVPVPAPYAKTEQMKFTIFGIPIDPNSDFNPHRVIRDRSSFENL